MGCSFGATGELSLGRWERRVAGGEKCVAVWVGDLTGRRPRRAS